MLELNDVLLDGEPRTLSLMAYEGKLTCLYGGSAEQRSRCLYGMLGFVPVKSGYISFDGEPLTADTVQAFRSMMAYAPSQLYPVGQLTVYEPPSVQDVFDLKANQDITITNGLLNREVKLVGDVPEEQAQRLAVAVLRDKPILLVDNPADAALDYLHLQTQQGRIVIVTSQSDVYRQAADTLVLID